MGGRPRVRHLECGEHQTVIVNVEETAGHLTGDCADVVGRLSRPMRGQVLSYMPCNSPSLLGNSLSLLGKTRIAVQRPNVGFRRLRT